ncbi:hypothetical protein EDB19DRAFT_1893928 [Suillus lakei]|nr:hypothetical protein EDB19DRAFT_1893928 [Suillus lakei]
MASLLKVPFILLSAITQQVSFTTPNVPSMDPHSARDIRISDYEGKVYWTVSLAEIATIVSHATGSLSVIQAITQHAVGQSVQDTPITFPFILGTALAVAGGLVRWWCFRTLGRFFTFKLSVRKGHHIVTTGPYAVIRHPSYTAGMVQVIGILILHGSPTSWLRHSGVLDVVELKMAVVAWLAGITLLMINVVCRVSQEDEILKSAFGDEWERWAGAVRYWLIPGIY